MRFEPHVSLGCPAQVRVQALGSRMTHPLSVAFSRNLLDLDTFSKSDPSRRRQGREGELGSGRD